MNMKMRLMNRMLVSSFFFLALSVGVAARENPVMMLRLRMPNTISETNWENLLSGFREYPDCCDEVWFSTGISATSLDVHRKHVEKLARAKDDLSKIGIGASVQVQMTIGHGDSMLNPDGWAAKTWSGWTGSTGVEDKFCNCPRQPAFLEYMRQVARLYAQIKPRSVWIDDDLRYDNHYPATEGSRIGCWCATCIADFSRQEGRDWTRKSLDEAMAADEALAERWKMFSISSLDNIARIVAEETAAVSPETQMGYQKTYFDSDTTVVRTILHTLARVSGKKVFYRPGGTAYYDKLHPANQIIKSMSAARYMKVLGCGDIIESWCPEVENWPRHYGSRTGQSVLLEGFAALAYGLDAVSMFVLDNGEEDIEVQKRCMLRPMHEGATVLKKYARANEGTQPVGYTAGVTNSALFDFALAGVPVLPGLGHNLCRLNDADMKCVNIYLQPSSEIQAFRQKLADKAAPPVLCCSPFVGLLIPRVATDGSIRTLGLVNCRIDEQSVLRFSLPALPARCKTAVWHELRKKPVKLKIERSGDGNAYVEVPSLGAWNAGFIEF